MNYKILSISIFISIVITILQRVLNLSATTIYHLSLLPAILDAILDIVLFTAIAYFLIVKLILKK